MVSHAVRLGKNETRRARQRMAEGGVRPVSEGARGSGSWLPIEDHDAACPDLGVDAFERRLARPADVQPAPQRDGLQPSQRVAPAQQPADGLTLAAEEQRSRGCRRRAAGRRTRRRRSCRRARAPASRGCARSAAATILRRGGASSRSACRSWTRRARRRRGRRPRSVRA